MIRVRFVCQSSVLKTGNLPQKQIKVYCFAFFVILIFFNCLFPVIQALVALVNEPEPEHPLRADLAEEFLKDRKKFSKNAEEYTKKHSEKRPAD